MIIITSASNEQIYKLTHKYLIGLYINDGEKGTAQDWNFALSQVKTRYATIVYQDDCYE